MYVSVRTKLALSTGLSLLFLLLVFHFGSRVIFVRAFDQAERELLRAMPDVKRLLLHDISRLNEVTEARATDPATIHYLKSFPASQPAPIFTPELIHALDLKLYALLDARSELVAGGGLDASGRQLIPLSPSFRRHLAPGLPLVRFPPESNQKLMRYHHGMLRTEEGGLMVSSWPVRDPTNQQFLGVLVVGRTAGEPTTTARIAAAIRGLQPGMRRVVLDASRNSTDLAPLSQEMLKDSVELGGLLFWRKPFGLLEARMPVYDIYGYPAFFLVFSLPRSIAAGLAENTLVWLTLMVAGIGIVFVVPLFLIQDRTVLNPLSRLTRDIRSFGSAFLSGRRLNWRRQDEFGEVARSVDHMLDSVESGLARIAEGERRNRAFLDVIPDMLFMIDRQGAIRDAKIKPGSRLAIQADALIGRTLRDAGLPPETCGLLLASLRNVLSSGHLETLDFHLVQPDGRPFWGELRIARIDDELGLVIERNATDRHQLEEDRRRLGEHLNQVHKMESLGILASGIAHDFNNILTAIMGHAELIDLAAPGAPSHASVESIRTAAMRASGLTRQIMSYAGKGEIAAQVLDLNHLLEDMVPLLQTSLSKKATLDIKFAADMPPVLGDATQLWQVAMNLLLNASDALDDNPGRITLATRRLDALESDLAGVLSSSPLKPGIYAVLEVVDTGKGMDAATRARIFDPFFSTKARGRGLGLSAVLGIVQSHGGGIEVESAPGCGSTFRVFLPASAQGMVPLVLPPAALPPQPMSPVLDRPLVLLAEDEPDIRLTITQTLISAGFEVLAAPDGAQAVMLFREHHDKISLVLMDVEMPEQSGEDALRAIRRISPHVKAFVMSGYGVTMLLERFASLAVTGFIAKPFTRAQLLGMLTSAGLATLQPAAEEPPRLDSGS